MHISVDFITKLPLAQEYDAILVVVDWLTKMVYFIPTTEKTSAEGLARLLRDNVWKLYSLHKSIISDRGPQFAAGLMRELNRMLGIKSKILTVTNFIWTITLGILDWFQGYKWPPKALKKTFQTVPKTSQGN